LQRKDNIIVSKTVRWFDSSRRNAAAEKTGKQGFARGAAISRGEDHFGDGGTAIFAAGPSQISQKRRRHESTSRLRVPASGRSSRTTRSTGRRDSTNKPVRRSSCLARGQRDRRRKQGRRREPHDSGSQVRHPDQIDMTDLGNRQVGTDGGTDQAWSRKKAMAIARSS